MSGLYGLMAEFEREDALLAAARAAHNAGYRRLDAFSPVPVEGLAEAIGFRYDALPLITLLGGLAGAVTGFGMQVVATVFDYPLNVGGRPHFSWPDYIPITFELTVLFAAIAAFVGLWWLNGLPRPHHPVFDAPCFQLASRDRFFLLIESADAHFDKAGTRAFLESHAPGRVEEVVP